MSCDWSGNACCALYNTIKLGRNHAKLIQLHTRTRFPRFSQVQFWRQTCLVLSSVAKQDLTNPPTPAVWYMSAYTCICFDWKEIVICITSVILAYVWSAPICVIFIFLLWICLNKMLVIMLDHNLRLRLDTVNCS